MVHVNEEHSRRPASRRLVAVGAAPLARLDLQPVRQRMPLAIGLKMLPNPRRLHSIPNPPQPASPPEGKGSQTLTMNATLATGSADRRGPIARERGRGDGPCFFDYQVRTGSDCGSTGCKRFGLPDATVLYEYGGEAGAWPQIRDRMRDR